MPFLGKCTLRLRSWTQSNVYRATSPMPGNLTDTTDSVVWAGLQAG